MALMQLPAELLLLILGYLGPEYFCEDVDRLTISRRWWHSAWTVLDRRLQFTETSLVKFTKHQAVPALSEPYLTAITLSIGIPDHIDNKAPPSPPGANRSQAPLADAALLEDALPQASVSMPSGPTPASFNAAHDAFMNWRLQLNLSLGKLASTLHRCQGMRSLRIETRELSAPRYFLVTKPFVGLLLSVQHLTSLEIDTRDCLLPERSSSNIHLCCSINTLLPSLRRLRCRMEKVCEKLLKPPPGEVPLALEEVIVHLSVPQKGSNGIMPYRYATRCRFQHVDHFMRVVMIMEHQARELTLRLGNPRMVRIMTYEFMRTEAEEAAAMYAYDAIEERRIRLGADANWDAEGEILDEVTTPYWMKYFIDQFRDDLPADSYDSDAEARDG